MAIQTIEYLKSRFENGDTPDENDFADVFDTFESLAVQGQKSIVVEIKGIIIFDTNDPQNNFVFEVDISLESDFSEIILSSKSYIDNANWEYWNGVSMEQLPKTGLVPHYQDIDTGLVTFTWKDAVGGEVYYIRYRSGFSDIWSDYRVSKIAV